MDTGPTKYDDVDYHDGAAAEAGQPREHAFAHIGMYLAWIIRHDLHDPRWFPGEHIEAVARAEMTGSDLADDTDWKLLSDLMTPEGAAFSDARYETYLGDYTALFADEPDYGFAEDDASYARVEPMIDRLYADWVAADRPGPDSKEPSQLDEEFEKMFAGAEIPWDELVAGADGPVDVQFNADGSYDVRRPETPHSDSDLEALVPPDLLTSPIDMASTTATDYGSSLLNRAMKELGVRPRDVTIATGLAREGGDVFGLTLYRVPGASAEALSTAFAAAIFRPRGSKWEIRRVGDIDVWWAEGYADPDRTIHFNIAYWTRDDLVLHVFGRPVDMETAIRRLG